MYLVVGVGFFGSDFFDVVFDVYLVFQSWLEEGYGCLWIGCQLLVFGVFVVGEEGEVVFVEVFEQEDMVMWIVVGVDGGQGYGVGFDWQVFGFYCVVELLVEQVEGIVRGVGFVEVIVGVFVVYIGQGLGYGVFLGGNVLQFNCRFCFVFDLG